MQIGLNKDEKESFEFALDSGLFDQETILKKMLETCNIELVEIIDEEQGE